MKILQTNFIIPVHCKIQNDDGSVMDKLLLIDNNHETIYECPLQASGLDNDDVRSVFFSKDSILEPNVNQFFISDLVDQPIPTMEDVENMVKDKILEDQYQETEKRSEDA